MKQKKSLNIEFNNKFKSPPTILPFPEYKSDKNCQIFIYLASIFSPFIDKSPTENHPLKTWIYNYKSNYPHMPNIFDLILCIGLNPQEVMSNQSDSILRIIFHKFCQKFASEFEVTIKETSMAISHTNLKDASDDKYYSIFKNIEPDMIIFLPMFSPVLPFSIGKMEKGEWKYDISINSDFLIPFYSETVTEGSAFNDESDSNNNNNDSNNNNNNNNNDNNSNSNNNDNNNNNNDSNNNNSNSNNKPKIIKKENYKFYGGIFNVSERSIRYALIKMNDNRYCRYNSIPDVDDLNNDNQNLYKTVDFINKIPEDDFCIYAFYLKENSSLSNLARALEKL